MQSTSEGMRVSFLPLEPSMADRLAELGNDAEVSMYAASEQQFPFPYGRDDALSFIEASVAEAAAGIGFHFAVAIEGSEIIGAAGIGRINSQESHAEIGYWQGKEYWHKGYGTETSALLLRIGFYDLGLNKISCIVPTDNVRSARLLEKLGFKNCGVLREEMSRGGRFMDCSIYEILKREFDSGMSAAPAHSPIS